MPNYRRWRQEGGCFFLTVVTYGRRPLFADTSARELLHQALRAVANERPWTTEAMVLLPDHWHALWRLPAGDTDYSTRVARVKKTFTGAWIARGGKEQAITESQRRLRRRGIWQVRFLEHTIRSARDFKKHLDYIHLNPVKHGYVRRPVDWPWSTFRQWVAKGEYDAEWLGRTDLPGSVEYYWPDG